MSIEVVFEHYNRSREIATTLRHIEKQSMFKAMIRCRMEGKHRVIAVFEHEDDIRSVSDQLARVYGIGCLVSWYSLDETKNNLGYLGGGE